jgi:hypothetical protein
MENKTITIDGWLIEKIIHSLTEVAGAAGYAKAIERLRLNSVIPSEDKRQYEFLLEAIMSDLYAALYDLTKVAATLNERSIWDHKDRDEIYEGGRQGLATVLTKYGFTSWLISLGLEDVSPETLARKESAHAVLQRVRELSEGLPENRTLIYVELRQISRDAIARIILDLIEPVTQGEKSWAEFQKEIENLLKDS